MPLQPFFYLLICKLASRANFCLPPTNPLRRHRLFPIPSFPGRTLQRGPGLALRSSERIEAPGGGPLNTGLRSNSAPSGPVSHASCSFSLAALRCPRPCTGASVPSGASGAAERYSPPPGSPSLRGPGPGRRGSWRAELPRTQSSSCEQRRLSLATASRVLAPAGAFRALFVINWFGFFFFLR